MSRPLEDHLALREMFSRIPLSLMLNLTQEDIEGMLKTYKENKAKNEQTKNQTQD